MIWLIVGYVVSVIFAYGSCFAFFQGKFPLIAEENYSTDLAFALLMSCLGPISIISGYFTGYRFKKYGLKFW